MIIETIGTLVVIFLLWTQTSIRWEHIDEEGILQIENDIIENYEEVYSVIGRVLQGDFGDLEYIFKEDDGLSAYQLFQSLLGHQIANKIWHARNGSPIYFPTRSYHLTGEMLAMAVEGRRIHIVSVPVFLNRTVQFRNQLARETYGLPANWEKKQQIKWHPILRIRIEDSEHPMVIETHRFDRYVFRVILGPGVTWMIFPGDLSHIPIIWRDMIDRFRGRPPRLVNMPNYWDELPP